MIAEFLDTFVKPYMDNQEINFRTGEGSLISDVINKKIEELKPYLQDNETNNEIDNNKLKLRGEHDTTIIEFMPKTKSKNAFSKDEKQRESFTDDIKKYKKLRKKIAKALDNDTVCEKTKKLVTTTVDDMMARIIGNQCNWRSTSNSGKFNKVGRVEPITLANIWSELWKNMISQLKPNYKSRKSNDHEKTLVFLGHFQEFVAKIINDTQSLSKNYKFICHLINGKNKDGELKEEFKDSSASMIDSRKAIESIKHQNKTKLDKKILRNNGEKDTCGNFKVCSEELREFMSDFYNNLNDTAVSTLRNYAAMFTRDVYDSGGKEKHFIISQLNKTSEDIEHKISMIFQKRTNKFQLNRNRDKDENINALNSYIKKTLNHVKKQITKELSTYLKTLRAKLLTNIQKDIKVNLDVDLGNLEIDISGKICVVFASCNGDTARRQRADESTDPDPIDDKNSIFVKVQLTFDDNKIKQPVRRIGLNVGKAMRVDAEENIDENKKVTSVGLLNVTRTTYDYDNKKKDWTKPTVDVKTASLPDLNANKSLRIGDVTDNMVIHDDKPDTVIMGDNSKAKEVFYKKY